MHVAVYLQHVLESTKSCSSVDSAFYAVKWAYEIAGTDNQVVSRVSDDAKKILGAGRLNRKDHLSTDVLKDIVEGADLSNILHLRNICLCVLAYADFYFFLDPRRFLISGWITFIPTKGHPSAWLSK